MHRQLGHGLVTVAVVKSLKKESMYGLSAGTKNVAVVRMAVGGGSTIFRVGIPA